MAAIELGALKDDIVSLLTDAEDVLSVVEKFDDLPELDKLAPFITEAQKVLADVLEFLNAT